MWKYRAMEETGFTLGILSGDFVRIAVTGRNYPNSLDYWDGNWLTSTITVQAGVRIRHGFKKVERRIFHRLKEHLPEPDKITWTEREGGF